MTTVLAVAMEIAAGMTYLHDRGIVHGDLSSGGFAVLLVPIQSSPLMSVLLIPTESSLMKSTHSAVCMGTACLLSQKDVLMGDCACEECAYLRSDCSIVSMTGAL